MKRLGLFFFAAIFFVIYLISTSCSSNSKTGEVLIILDSTTITTSDTLKGDITSINDIESVNLVKITSGTETSVTGWPLTNFSSTSSQVYGSKGSYTIAITGLSAGTYRLTASDGGGNSYKTQFKVVAATASLFSAKPYIKANKYIGYCLENVNLGYHKNIRLS